jgi:hypothetical protein
MNTECRARAYLVRKKNPTKPAHIFLLDDTLCHMWSTGGIRRRNDYSVVMDPGDRPICRMCEVNDKKVNP